MSGYSLVEARPLKDNTARRKSDAAWIGSGDTATGLVTGLYAARLAEQISS
jgi:hypothetical protein